MPKPTKEWNKPAAIGIREQNLFDLESHLEKFRKKANLEFLHTGGVFPDTQEALESLRLEIDRMKYFKFSVATPLIPGESIW